MWFRNAMVPQRKTCGNGHLTLASIDYRRDEWGVDVALCCSQKGLMLPPGLGLNAVSRKALEASTSARLPRSYWDWEMLTGTLWGVEMGLSLAGIPHTNGGVTAALDFLSGP